MQTLNQNIGVLGEIKAEFFNQSTLTKAQKKFNAGIDSLRKFSPSLARKINLMKLYQLGAKIGEDEHKNIICNAGFFTQTSRLTGDLTYTGVINKALLGTGSGTLAASRTQLFTEAYRNDQASGTAASNIAYLTAYFTETETTGTFTEFGNCIDGTASANTGQLWSHIAGLSWVKDSSTVIVVSQKYTFASI
jgi:hypothetical protein